MHRKPDHLESGLPFVIHLIIPSMLQDNAVTTERGYSFTDAQQNRFYLKILTPRLIPSQYIADEWHHHLI